MGDSGDDPLRVPSTARLHTGPKRVDTYIQTLVTKIRSSSDLRKRLRVPLGTEPLSPTL